MIRAQVKTYKRFTRSRAGNAFFLLFLVLAGAFSALPLIYCVLTSIKPLDELLVFPPRFFVYRPTIENFLALPRQLASLRIPLSRYVFNSLFVAFAASFLHILLSSMAAFGFSKSKAKGRIPLFIIVQFSLLYNAYTLAVPQYLIFSSMRVIDTYLAYILPAIPASVGVFLMKQFIDSSVPDALLEAARIDGAGVFRMYASIVMPIARPAWMTLLLFSFRDMWATVPSATNTFIFREELKTLPYILPSISAGGVARMGMAMAATVILMIPPIVVYCISQRYMIETMSTAGMKG